MTEILRRFGLIFCLGVACWLWFASPPLLISVRKPDFAREYKRRMPLLALEESAERPGRITLEEYRRRMLRSRTLPPPSSDVSTWLQELDEALEGRGPEARRVANGEAYYLPDEQPVAQWVAALQEVYRKGSWLNAYLSIEGRDLEFFLYPEARESKAPHWILYPQRSSAWNWVLGGVLVYLFLPGRARRLVRHDPVPIAVMDVIGAVLISFFWALPLALYETNEAAVGDWLGGPGLSWLAAGLILALLVRNAASAAFELEVRDDSIRLRRLLGASEIPFHEIHAVQPLEDQDARVGLKLTLVDGREIALPWNGILNYSMLTDALASRGLYPAR